MTYVFAFEAVKVYQPLLYATMYIIKGLCHAILASFKKAKKCLGIN